MCNLHLQEALVLGSCQFDLGLCVSFTYKLYWPSCVCSPRFSQSKDWFQYFSIIVISCIVFIQYFSFNDLKHVLWPLCIFIYWDVLLPARWTYQDSPELFIAYSTLLKYLFILWVYNKALINRDIGPYGKYLFWRSRRMDLTAFGPYALNVRINISSYGPRARLIRAYYRNVLWTTKEFYGSMWKIFLVETAISPAVLNN